MIQQLTNLPANMVGFKATGDVNKEDFENTVMPAVQKLVEKTDNLNYLLVLDTSIKNFSLGAWFKDAILGLKHLTKWHRAAIVSDSEGIKKFTAVFSALMPGEFKGFYPDQLQQAIAWTSAEDID